MSDVVNLADHKKKKKKPKVSVDDKINDALNRFGSFTGNIQKKKKEKSEEDEK